MKHLSPALSLLLVAAPVMATTPGMQTSSDVDAVETTPRSALDLSLPKSSESTLPQAATTDQDATPATNTTGDYNPGYLADPPGTYYGDRSGRPAPASGVLTREAAACDGQLHGSVSMGMGYSRRGGNSNWQATQLNTCKRYVTDSGKERQIGLSISVGQGSGPGYWGGHGAYGGYYGPGGGYYDGAYNGHYDGFGGPGPGWRGMPSPVW